ncbi:hypothetical protein SKAU_G00123560 [Synaphobranchus kaupii]|uniref:SAM domain-containing protein n=1 Tax=Synaphobranchus kaupii TaxID=118154 RepID=A0A9Q1FPN8_SYNKA|nr:hypothetical protein SKAU_G00123560 [Synaphobranchus kaupii]
MTDECNHQPIENWTECDVSSWLKSIGVKENYIKKINEEEVDGKSYKIPCEMNISAFQTHLHLFEQASWIFCNGRMELPMVHTFYEFYSEMQGHEDIICISESEENHRRWTSLAEERKAALSVCSTCSQSTYHRQ